MIMFGYFRLEALFIAIAEAQGMSSDRFDRLHMSIVKAEQPADIRDPTTCERHVNSFCIQIAFSEQMPETLERYRFCWIPCTSLRRVRVQSHRRDGS